MKLSNLLGATLILLCIVFLGLQSKGLEVEAFGVKAIAMVFLILLYFVKVKSRSILFALFLLTYGAAEVYNYYSYYDYVEDLNTVDPYYLIGNLLFILAYIFMIAKVLSIMDFSKALVKFPLQILLLFGLGVFVVYMITDISRDELEAKYLFITELIYNSVVMFLVCLSLVNYMYNDTKKSMNLLIGSILIVFSEVIQVAYYYISDYDNTLSVIYSVFLVGAFVFFYLQSTIDQEQNSVYAAQEVNA
ncbi:hypothetical protein ACU8DI_04740 [Psychroserpens sp. BH13MA-6]